MRILCLCAGNKDRSPAIRAFIVQMLQLQGRDVEGMIIDSAGVLDSAKAGGSAPELAVNAAKVFGIYLQNHVQTHVESVDLEAYDLYVVADKMVQAELIKHHYPKRGEVVCLELDGVANAWMSNDPRKVDEMLIQIQAAVYRYIGQYLFRVD